MKRIAVSYDQGDVYEHFGHSPYIKFYDVENGKVVASGVSEVTNCHGGALVVKLYQVGTNVIIANGMGPGPYQTALNGDIEVFTGVSGESDKAVEQYLAGTLTSDPSAIHCCGHHHQ